MLVNCPHVLSTHGYCSIVYDSEFSMGDHMFNDLALSRDTIREFHEHRQRLGNDHESQKLTVMVLQQSFWPFAAKTHITGLLPPSVRSPLYTPFFVC